MATRYLRLSHGSFRVSSHPWQKPTVLSSSFLADHLVGSTRHQLHPNSNNCKAYIPHHLIQPGQRKPFIYRQHSSAWQPVTNFSPGLNRGSVLTTASWNLNWSDPDPAARTLAALDHLKEICGTEAHSHVIMLQEVSPSSLRAIIGHRWVQHTFVLSDVKPPEVPRRVTLSKSSDLTKSIQKELSYFTVIMASRNLPVTACFRVPLITNMGRDCLAMDIHTLGQEDAGSHQECVRLCTTHLESLWQGKEHRRGQLAVISDLLKNPILPGCRVIAGVVGGDMNAIDRSEHAYHKESQVDLRDIWEDSQTMSQQHGNCQHEGDTWGHKSSELRGSKRLDKFLYTGAVESLAFESSPDYPERVRRFGVGLKTTVEVWELEREDTEVVGGQAVKKLHKEYVSQERFNTLNELGFLKSVKGRRTKMDARVSDHCGILARIRIV